MSRYVKRIGKKTIKFQVNVNIEKVLININFACQLFVTWKRGPRTQETKKIPMDLSSGSAVFNEELQLSATMFQDTKTKKYQEKKSSFTVGIITPKGMKTAGVCDVDLASYANQGIAEKKEVLGLKKCPDPNAKLYFKIQVTLLSEVDNMSMMSDIVEQDSEEEAGSMEVSQLDHDTTVTAKKNNLGPSNMNMDNVLSSLSSKTRIEEDVKQATFKQEDDSPKIHGLNQPSNQPYNPRKLTADKTEMDKSASSMENKKQAGGGFNKLFGGKEKTESVTEAHSRIPQKTTQAAEPRKSVSQEHRTVNRERDEEPKRQDDYPVSRNDNHQQNGNYAEELNELKAELAKKQTECTKLRRALDNLKEENEELRTSGRPSAGTSARAESQEMMELRQRISDKNNEISELTLNVEELQKEIDDLKQNIYKLNKEKQQENRGITQEIEKLKSENKASEQEKAKLQQEIHNQASKISRLETDLKNWKSDYQTLKQENAGNLELYHSLRDQADEMANSNQSSDMEIKRHKDKIANLEQEIQRLREQGKTVQAERDDFQKKGMELTNIAKEKIRVAEEENAKLKERFQEMEKGYKEQLTKVESSLLDLKKQLKESESKKEEALSKQTQQAIELQNLKINFERVNSELTYKNDNFSSKSKDLESMKEGAEKEMSRLRERLAVVESQAKKSEIEYQRKVEELSEAVEKNQKMYEEAAEENEKLKDTLRKKEKEASMKSSKDTDDFESVKNSLESQVKVLTEDLSLRTTTLNGLKKENKDLMEQVSALKQQNVELEAKAKTNKEDPKVIMHMNELQEKIRLTEFNSKVLNKDLQEENDRLKKELNEIKKNTKAAQDVEKEVGHLSIENETLKKQVRELTAKASNTKISADNQNAKDNEELKKKVKDLTRSLKKAEDDYNETKEKLAGAQKKNTEDDELLLRLNKKVTTLQELVDVMENDLVKNKQKIGEIINVIMDCAEQELVDKVHGVIYEDS